MEKPEAYLKYEEAQQRKRPEVLYHYTSAQAAISILDNKSFWATESRYLNDPTEIVNTLQVAFEVSESIFHSIGISREEATNYDIDRMEKDEMYKFSVLLANLTYSISPQIIENGEAYIVSFSKDGDSLSQWRAYCPRGGYALGFEVESLHSRIKNNFLGFDLKPCTYLATEEKADFFNYWLRTKASEYKRYIYPEGLRHGERYYGHQTEIVDLAMSMKDTSFREEKEWRLIEGVGTFFPHVGPHVISRDYKTEKFRDVDNLVMPYKEIEFEDDAFPLKDVVVGPSPRVSLAERGMKHYLWEKGFGISNADGVARDEGVQVRATRSPYLPL